MITDSKSVIIWRVIIELHLGEIRNIADQNAHNSDIDDAFDGCNDGVINGGDGGAHAGKDDDAIDCGDGDDNDDGNGDVWDVVILIT